YIVDIHEKLRILANDFRQQIPGFFWSYIMVLGDYAAAFDPRRSFDDPVAGFLLMESAIVTYPVFHFPISIFSPHHPIHFFSTHPKPHFTLAGGTIPVRIHRLGKPNAVFKPEGLVGEGAYRA